MYEEYYRECAEWTANFHAGNHNVVDDVNANIDTTTTTATTSAIPYLPGRNKSGGGDYATNMVWKIPRTTIHTGCSGTNNNKKKNKTGNDDKASNEEDINSLMMRIYEWYDEVVA